MSVLNPRNLPSFCQKLANPSLPLSAYVQRSVQVDAPGCVNAAGKLGQNR